MLAVKMLLIASCKISEGTVRGWTATKEVQSDSCRLVHCGSIMIDSDEGCHIRGDTSDAACHPILEFMGECFLIMWPDYVTHCMAKIKNLYIFKEVSL